jgi:Flp pilus assembly protein TadD
MRFSILVLLMGLAGCAGSSSSTSQTGAAGLRVADAAIANGLPSVALQMTKAMLDQNPRDTEALLRQAKASLMLGKTIDAEASYRAALSINDHLVEARLGLARIMMASDPAGAETMYQAIIAQNPKNTAALNDLGVSRDLQGRHADAQEAYHRALAIAPELASARQNLGLSLAVSGKPAEAAALLGQLAKEGDTDRRARDNLALALALTGRTSEADKVLREEMSGADATKALAGYRDLSADPAPMAATQPDSIPPADSAAQAMAPQ